MRSYFSFISGGYRVKGKNFHIKIGCMSGQIELIEIKKVEQGLIDRKTDRKTLSLLPLPAFSSTLLPASPEATTPTVVSSLLDRQG